MFFIAEKQQGPFLFFFGFINFNRITLTMEQQKILNLLNEPNNSNFMTRKCNIVNGQSNANYDAGNKIIYNRETLKSL